MTEIPAFDLHTPTDRIVCEAGALRVIDRVIDLAQGERVTAVIDPFFEDHPERAPFVERIRQATGQDPAFVLAPDHEPDVDDVARIRDELAEQPFNTLFVIGGGTAIDTAKTARMCLANDGAPVDVAALGPAMRGHESRFIAVPTTAGTGSEVTEVAVINKTGDPVKIVFRTGVMAPDVAILDAVLGCSAPASVTAASGFDALTHAVEAYIARRANPFTDALARDALVRIARSLPRAYADPANLDARADCLVASCQAGLAFNTAQLGLAHALSAPLGVRWGVGHGYANALTLPAVMAFNEPVLGDKGKDIATLLDAPNAASGLAAIRADLGLDQGLDTILKTPEERAALVDASRHSGQVANNPREADTNALAAIVEAMRAPIGRHSPTLHLNRQY